MNSNPFSEPVIKIKSRKNPMGEYAHLSTPALLEAVKRSAHSPHRADLDMLLSVFLERYDERQKELDTLNKELEQRIHKEVKLAQSNHKRFEQQAKMAAMGEMMDAVAHQWKQPLNAISMMSDMLVDDFKNGLVDEPYIQELSNDTQTQIEHMVNTLSEFRNFFRPKETKESFGIKRSLSSVLVLVNDEFIKNNINIHIQSDKEILIHGIENEFKHLVLNIINNAKDAFNERDVKSRDIYITFEKDEQDVCLSIRDTAGGIPLNVIDHIFQPEVTTKPDGKGTGIGLYMSTQIANKLGGKLSVENVKDGALFTLKIASEA
jgi:C4-dicarboxylate-specific signal transduction histidine kinase